MAHTAPDPSTVAIALRDRGIVAKCEVINAAPVEHDQYCMCDSCESFWFRGCRTPEEFTLDLRTYLDRENCAAIDAGDEARETATSAALEIVRKNFRLV